MLSAVLYVLALVAFVVATGAAARERAYALALVSAGAALYAAAVLVPGTS